ncbi:MAG: PQQ-dependent sugar dehydrogenase [Leptospiraceae bacterium]|nr:PQQ-dependent sugar dehydrogenase [Leptospiraceae bacterium]MCP5512140.1 PQQ-dependent sugar dehydrogenase [Leptospiraceae bacterium]
MIKHIIFIYLICFIQISIFADDKFRGIQNEFMVSLETVTTGIFSPVALDFHSEDGSMYIAEQTGKVKVFSKNKLKKIPFLNLSRKIKSDSKFYSERGLLGFSLHPNFSKNRKFYVNYSSDIDSKEADHKTIVSEFQASLNNPHRSLLRSEKILLEIVQPESNHNGGTILFGPDKYLYIGSGDGGGRGDNHGNPGNGQNLKNLLGKILRIDVDKGNLYSIPDDNPFAGGGGLPEIYAYGFRNPWKFSFDRVSGELFVGDVGQESFEEINLVKKGKNYGWRIMEGNSCYMPPNCDPKGLELPIYTYSRDKGIAVIGGYVYRGNKKSKLYGKYIFADWSGKVYYLEKKKSTWTANELPVLNRDQFRFKHINSLAEDKTGNLYLLTQYDVRIGSPGEVLKIITD